MSMIPTNKILIIDDEEMMRLILRKYLSMVGYDVHEASTTKTALDLIKKINFDIAIVDIHMPQMSGEELIIQAKTIDPKIQFIIHTGTPEYAVSEQLKSLGIVQANVLVKPVEDMYTFQTTIQRLIDRRHHA